MEHDHTTENCPACLQALQDSIDDLALRNPHIYALFVQHDLELRRWLRRYDAEHPEQP